MHPTIRELLEGATTLTDDRVPVSEVAPIIWTLLTEVASELDLHYEDEDFFALTPTIDNMAPAIEFLRKHNVEPPEVVQHVLKRYRRARQ